MNKPIKPQKHPSSIREKCGVVAINIDENAPPIAMLLYNGLTSLQHRGQESCGITIHDGRGLRTHRDTGLVNEVFRPGIIARLDGQVGIGHVN